MESVETRVTRIEPRGTPPCSLPIDAYDIGLPITFVPEGLASRGMTDADKAAIEGNAVFESNYRIRGGRVSSFRNPDLVAGSSGCDSRLDGPVGRVPRRAVGETGVLVIDVPDGSAGREAEADGQDG
jgi:hypothetical protein